MSNNNLNGFDRTELLENTLFRLKQGLHKLDIEETITFQKHMGCSISAILTIPALRLTTSGKGVDFLMAETSAYAEMVERFSVVLEGNFNPTQYPQFSTQQLEKLQKFINYKYMVGYKYTHQDNNLSVIGVEDLLKNENFTEKDFDFFKSKSELLKHWIPGRSLVNKKDVFIPPVFVKWISATNGLASGNTMDEAILHACYEVFERFALISFLKSHSYMVPTVDNASINNETIQEMIKFFENNGIEVEIKDLSLNNVLPIYAVMFFNKNVSVDSIMYNSIKAGVSFNKETAIIRCFTERLQGINFQDQKYDNTLRDDSFPDKYLHLFFKGICSIDLRPYRSNEKVSFVQHRESDLLKCVNKCVDVAKLINTDLVVVDHTHPILDFPTVRIVMPGISDFIKWWDPNKVTVDLIADYNKEENAYQNKFFNIIDSFEKNNLTNQN